MFYEPLRRLKEVVESGEIGEVSGYHMKMVASGRGGWDVPGQQLRVAVPADAGRGGASWSSTTGGTSWPPPIWLFGPIKEVRAWVGGTEVVPGIEVDAPTTIVWEHENGIRGVWDITLAIDMYLRSDYYTNDERWEVTGRQGIRPGQPLHRAAASSSRASRCTPTARCAATTPSTTTGPAASATRAGTGCGGSHTGEGPMLWSGEEAVDVLRFALAAYASSEAGGIGVDPASLG